MQPHQSAEMALERTVTHNKWTCPSCYCHGKL